MTQEEKELLLKDISARLPYGVKMYCGEDIIMTLRQIDKNCFCECWENEDLKCHSRWMLPYLRSMNSMTEEERNELSHYDNSVQRTDFFYSHHIDCRFMIEKGLALEAPEGMYNIKEQ